jgi:ligand-binding sensor domain-containing protein
MFKRLLVPCLLPLSIFLSVIFIGGIVAPKSYAAIENLSLELLSVEDGLSQGSVISIIQDKTGFIWLATENGVNVYDGNTVRQLPGPKNSFENVAIYNVLEDQNGLIWLNVDGRKLYSYNPKTDAYQYIPIKLAQGIDYYITDLINDYDNKIWVLTSKTLGVYNQITDEYQQVIDFEAEFIGDSTLYKMSLYDGVMYISSQTGVFAYDIEKRRWKKLPQISEDVTKQSNIEEFNKIYTVHADKNQTLYLGSFDGFFAINVAQIKAYIAGESQLPHYQQLIENMAPWQTLLDEEILYVASDKGLYAINILNNHSEFLFGFSDYFDDITDDNIKTLIKDNRGIFWLGSNTVGAYQWDPQKELVKNYGYERNNPASLSYNEVWHALPDSLNQDLLWVATSNGLNLIDLTEQRVNSFLVNNDSKSIYTTSHIYKLLTLSPEQLLVSTAQGVQLFDKKQEKTLPLPFNSEINQLLALEQFDI